MTVEEYEAERIKDIDDRIIGLGWDSLFRLRKIKDFHRNLLDNVIEVSVTGIDLSVSMRVLLTNLGNASISITGLIKNLSNAKNDDANLAALSENVKKTVRNAIKIYFGIVKIVVRTLQNLEPIRKGVEDEAENFIYAEKELMGIQTLLGNLDSDLMHEPAEHKAARKLVKFTRRDVVAGKRLGEHIQDLRKDMYALKKRLERIFTDLNSQDITKYFGGYSGLQSSVNDVIEKKTLDYVSIASKKITINNATLALAGLAEKCIYISKKTIGNDIMYALDEIRIIQERMKKINDEIKAFEKREAVLIYELRREVDRINRDFIPSEQGGIYEKEGIDPDTNARRKAARLRANKESRSEMWDEDLKRRWEIFHDSSIKTEKQLQRTDYEIPHEYKINGALISKEKISAWVIKMPLRIARKIIRGITGRKKKKDRDESEEFDFS